MAHHDGSTGIPNRRYFESYAAQALAGRNAAGRRGAFCSSSISTASKHIEPTTISAHQAGDRLLKEIAAGLRARMRKSDFLARLGGDESRSSAKKATTGPILPRWPDARQADRRHCRSHLPGCGVAASVGSSLVSTPRPGARPADARRRHGDVSRQGRRPPFQTPSVSHPMTPPQPADPKPCSFPA